MTTPPRLTTSLRPRLLASAALALTLALVAAACGAAAPSAAPASGQPASEDPGQPSAITPTPVPGAPGSPDQDPGSGGGSAPGNPGGGGIIPVPIPFPGGDDPSNPQPSIVTPVAGVRDAHPVPAARLEAAVSGRDVAVRLSWTSGVEPCYALAGVTIVRNGTTFTLTINEGSAAAPDTACVEIALFKATIVDLGELDPGTYTIRAFGDAAPVEVTVAG